MRVLIGDKRQDLGINCDRFHVNHYRDDDGSGSIQSIELSFPLQWPRVALDSQLRFVVSFTEARSLAYSLLRAIGERD